LLHVLETQKGGGKDAILKQKLELLQPTRRKLQVRPGNYYNESNGVANHNNDDKEYVQSSGGRDANPKKVCDGGVSVHQNRKPRGYWKSVANIDRELRDQWLEAIGTINSKNKSDNLFSLLYPPPVPNEALLNHWNRHDLRNAIWSFGGRKTLAEALTEHSQSTTHDSKSQNKNHTDCYIIPGKWKEMTGFRQHKSTTTPHPLISMVLEHDPLLHPERAPVSRGQMKRLQSKRYGMSEEDIASWMQGTTTTPISGDGNSTPLRKRADPGTWSRDTVTEVLCDYLGWRKRTRGIPSVWMPRLSEFENSCDIASTDERFGYLKNAITNIYGTTTSTAVTKSSNEILPNSRGVEKLCYEMGLVPYREWKEVEGFHDLMGSLKEHIDNEAAEAQSSPDYSVFPKGYSTTWRKSGYERLFYLVKNYGGKDLVAGRLGMATSLKKQQQKQLTKQTVGPFDLEFGISLMEYVKLDQLRREPLRQHQTTNLLAQYQERDDDKDDDRKGFSRSNRAKNNNNNCICMPTRNQLQSKSPSSPASFPFYGGANANKNQASNGNGKGNASSNTNNSSSNNEKENETWGKYLDRKIIAYNGYENVARRLGLEWCEL